MSRKKQMIILIIFCILGAGTIVVTAISITLIPKDTTSVAKRGIGADGFQAHIEDGANLGVGLIVSKNQTITALGNNAKSVGEAQLSKVFNYNGNLGQTVTFPFVRADGVASSLYIDKKTYKDIKALNDDHIYIATMSAGEINDLPLYYRHAQTIGNYREYHLMLVDGLTIYRFVIAQPDDNIYMSEVNSLATLKKLARVATL